MFMKAAVAVRVRVIHAPRNAIVTPRVDCRGHSYLLRMPDKKPSDSDESSPSISLAHGAKALSRVVVDHYNAELRAEEGFVGDRASKRAFQRILDEWREKVSEA